MANMRIKVFPNRGDLVGRHVVFGDSTSLESLKGLVWQALGYGDPSSVSWSDVRLFKYAAYSSSAIELESVSELTMDDAVVMTYGNEALRSDVPAGGPPSSSGGGLGMLSSMGILGPTSPAARIASPMRGAASPKRTNSSGNPPPPPPTVGGVPTPRRQQQPEQKLSSSMGGSSPLMDSFLDFSGGDNFGGGVGGGSGRAAPPPAFNPHAVGTPLSPGGAMDRSKSPQPQKGRQAMTSVDGGDPLTGRSKSPLIRFTTPPGPPPGGPASPLPGANANANVKGQKREDDAIAAYAPNQTRLPTRGAPPKPNFNNLPASSSLNNTLAMFDLPAAEEPMTPDTPSAAAAASAGGPNTALTSSRGGQVVDAYTAAYTRAMKMDPQLAQDFAAYSRNARDQLHHEPSSPATPSTPLSGPSPLLREQSAPPALTLSTVYEYPPLPDGIVAVCWARARWDFAATDTEDLGFKRGDIIAVTNKSRDDEGNWWEGVLGFKEGSFPSNHVELIPNPGGPPSMPSTPQAAAPTPTPSTPVTPHAVPIMSAVAFGSGRVSVAGSPAPGGMASRPPVAPVITTPTHPTPAALASPASAAKPAPAAGKDKDKDAGKEGKTSHRDERRKSRTTAFAAGVLRRSSIMKQNSMREKSGGGVSVKLNLNVVDNKFPAAAKAAVAAAAASAAAAAAAAAPAKAATTPTPVHVAQPAAAAAAAPAAAEDNQGVSAGSEYEVDGWGWVWGTAGWEWSPLSDTAKAAHQAWLTYNQANPDASAASGKLSPSQAAEDSYYNFTKDSLDTPQGDFTPREPATSVSYSASSSSSASSSPPVPPAFLAGGHATSSASSLGPPTQPSFNILSPTPPTRKNFFATPPPPERAGSRAGEDSPAPEAGGEGYGEAHNEIVEEDHDERTAAQKRLAGQSAFEILRDKYGKEGKAASAAAAGEGGDDEGRDQLVPVSPMPEHRRTSLHKYTLEQYAKERFALESRGLFGKALDIKSITSWQKKKLDQPLHRGLDDKETEEALENFSDILVFMGDRKGSKEKPTYMEVVGAMLERGLHGSEKLRDEIWAQLCKQTRYNPKTASQTLGWQLICVCSGAFAPSTILLHFVSVHLSATFAFLPEHRPFITYVRETLPVTVANGPRLFTPSHDEINAVMQLKKLFIKVELLDRQDLTLYVGPQSTAVDVAKMVTEELHMELPSFDGEPCFGISQVAHEDGVFIMESSLANNSRILDVIAGWLFAQIEASMAKERSKESIWKDVQNELAFKLVFKARLFVFDILREEKLTVSGLQMYFMQGLHDVVNLFYPTKEKDALMLAGLAAQAKFGGDLRSHHMISDRLADFLPSKYLNQLLMMLGSTELVQNKEAVMKDGVSPKLHKKTVSRIGQFFGKKESEADKAAEAVRKQKEDTIRYAIAEKVLAARKQFQDVPKETAMRMYLDFLFKLPHYGVQTFNVVYVVQCKHEDFDFEDMQLKGAGKNKSKNQLTEAVEYLLGVSEKGILYMNEETRGLKKHERLSNVAVEKVGFTKDLFWYISGNPARFETLKVHVFASTQGKKIKQLITTYKKLPYNFDKFDDTPASAASHASETQ